MDFLTSLETDQLLGLVVAILACAVMLAGLTLAYLLVSVRRARRGTQPAATLDGGSSGTAAVSVDRTDGLAGSVSSVAHDPSARVVAPVEDVPAKADAGSALETTGEVLRVVVDQESRCAVRVEGKEYVRWADVPDLLVRENIMRTASWCLRFSRGLVLTGQGAVSVDVPENDSVPVPEPVAGGSSRFGGDTLLRVLSDSREHGFWVQAGGDRPYSALYEVPDKETGERILKGITRLLQFCEGRVATDGGVARVGVPDLPADEPQATERTATAGSAPAGDADLHLAQEKFIQEMIDEKERLAQQAAKTSKSARVRAKAPPPAPAPEPQNFDLVGDIDRIFQSKLAISPLSGMDAEIVAGPDGGVCIRIGDARYGTPGDVPDRELRDIIRAAIEEW